MRKFIFLLLTSVLFYACGNVAIADFSSYPKMKTIVDKLDEDYRIIGSESVYFTVAKKPQGWFVVKMDKKTYKPVAEELFWSVKTKTYVKMPKNFFHSMESTGDKVKVASEMRGRDYSFDHSIYFGYDNWEDDALKVLDGASNLNDTLLEALARAHAAKCMDATRPEKEIAGKRSMKLSDEKTNDFCDHGNKTIEAYKKLLEVNPEYETMVGKVQTKLSNEYVFLWSELKQGGREKEAEQFLVADLYDELMINFAKNMLTSAEKDAILFCNGDNDTYPLWYVQSQMGIRKDIAVMNTSLMNIPNWVFSDKHTYNFEMKIAEKTYLDTMSDVLYLDPNQVSVFGMETVRAGIDEKDPSFVTKFSGGSYFQLPFNNIRLSYIADDSLAPVAHLKASYVLKSDLAILDIISSNLGKRPIYFAMTAIYGTMTDALEISMIQEGVLVKIIQGENKGKLSGGRYYNTDLFYDNLCNKYTYGFENLKSIQSEPIAANYVYTFHALSVALLESGDTLRANKAAEACINKIPFKLFEEPTGAFLMGQDLCRSGDPAEGKKQYVIAIDKIKTAHLHAQNEYDLRHYESILMQIITDSEKYGFADLISPATKLKEKITAQIAKKTFDKIITR